MQAFLRLVMQSSSSWGEGDCDELKECLHRRLFLLPQTVVTNNVIEKMKKRNNTISKYIEMGTNAVCCSWGATRDKPKNVCVGDYVCLTAC